MHIIKLIFGFLLLPFMLFTYTCIAPWYEKILQAGPRKWALLVFVSIFVMPFMGLAYIGGMLWDAM